MLMLARGAALFALACVASCAVVDVIPKVTEERVVFQIEEGFFEFGFYPEES